MTKNREGMTIELSEVEKVEIDEDGAYVTQKGGWTSWISSKELNGFVPQVGDWMLVTYRGFNTVAGIIIEGHVLRNKTEADIKEEHEQFKKDIRLKRLEEYVANGDNLKAQVKKLHPLFQARMARFEAESGIDFWIDSANYELYALNGAQALLNKVEELGLIANARGEFREGDHDEAVQWIEDWWNINSATHDPPYDYKKQMELVPDFGDAHSGNTAGAAKSLAVYLLKGNTDV